jgi:hypothetical protein
VKGILRFLLIALSVLSGSAAVAEAYGDTAALFENAGESVVFLR